MKRQSVVLAAILVLLQLCDGLLALPTTAYDAEMVVTGWLKAEPQPLGMTLGRRVEKVETFTDNHGEPAYHIVYLHPSGFTIVSADDLVEPIIGFVNSGTYDPSPQSPLGALVTKDLNGRMATIHSAFSPLSISPDWVVTETRQKWSYFIGFAEKQNGGFELMGQKPACYDNLSDVRVAPLIKSNWDQKLVYYETQTSLGPACYNYYTPQILPGGELSWDKGDEYYGNPDNYFCGCIATAMAQLMLDYQWPVEAPIQPDSNDPNNTVGIGEKGPDGAFVPLMPRVYRNLLGGDEHGGKYKWHEMDFMPDQNTTLAQRKAIGAICHDAGVAAKMDYTADGSSTDLFNAKKALVNNFRYSNAVWGSNGTNSLGSGLIGMILPNLDAKRPVILGISGESSGHSVVCDGYGYDITETLYHHLNMGWSGTDNCWYNLPTIECSVTGYEYETVFDCIYNVSKDSNGEIISGRVLNADNEPAEANVVCLEYEGRLIVTAETDANGIFAFIDVNSNATYTIWVEGRDFSSREVTTGISQDKFSVSGNRWAVDFPSSMKVVYADRQATAGTGDGSSWTNAFIDLQDALEAAANSPGKVSEIWVAAGTYKPDKGTKDRSLSFQLLDGVALYGGFAGNETYRQQRDPQTNITTLSGDLNDDDGESFAGRNDNSHHVVNCSGTHGTTIIDGFTITGGNAYSDTGGGMYIPGASPSVRNCIFRRNSAQYGAGIFIESSSPKLSNCDFMENQAAESGGGVYSYEGEPILNSCNFTGNTAYYGAGLYNYNSGTTLTTCTFNQNSADWGGGIFNDNSSPALSDCDFIENIAHTNGGGMHSQNKSDGKITECTFSGNSANWGGGIFNDNSSPALRDCDFVGNQTSDSGGGMFNNSGSDPTVDHCNFIGNEAKVPSNEYDSWGGGMANDSSSPILTTCTFRENSAERGAGMFNDNSSPALTDCDFVGNQASDSGGGMFNNSGSDPTVDHCNFIGNEAKVPSNEYDSWGGGMANDSSSPILTTCTFRENSAERGGSMYNYNYSNTQVTGCTFSGNSADNSGGAMVNDMSNSTITNCVFRNNSTKWGGGICIEEGCLVQMGNCTFAGNSASENGGGIYIDGGSFIAVTNCILWANTGMASEIVAHDEGTAVTISYCDIEDGLNGSGLRSWNGAPPVIDSGGNINTNPLFVSSTNGDFHLKSQAGRWDPVSQSWIADNVTSPCIDAGDPDKPVSDELEPNGGRINIGAYGGTVEASKSP